MSRLPLALLALLAFAPTAISQGQAPPTLIAAASQGNAAAVKELLEAGADVNATSPNDYGKTALHLAAEKGHSDVVRALIAHKADVNAKETFYKGTPLTWASFGRHAEVIGLLLEAGADGADEVLTLALSRGDVNTVRTVLEKGKVKPETLSRGLSLAKDRPELIALLEKAGAKHVPQPALPGEPVSGELIAALAGVYRTDTGAEFELAGADSKLFLRFNGQSVAEWRSTGADAFVSATNPAMTFQLTRDSGRMTGFVMTAADNKMSFQRGENSQPPAPPPAALEDKPGPVSPRNWPSFRGINASGVADDQWPPLNWDVEKGINVRWKTPLPGLGLGCPVVWEDRVFVTTAVSADGKAELKVGAYGDVDSVNETSEHAWHVYCLDKRSGRILWDHEAHRGVPKVKRHTKATHANCTPATNGTCLVASFGSEGLYCYDLSGRLLWKKDLGTLDAGWFFNTDYQWGFGSSPILYRDLVIVQCDVRENSFIAAYRLADGSEVWRTPRDEISSWGTPTIVAGPERDELVTNATKFARGYDPQTGTELWRLPRNAEITVPTPFLADNLIFVTSGYKAPTQPIYAIRPGARGDLSLEEGKTSSEHLAWSTMKGGPYMASPVAYRGYLFVCLTQGILTIYETQSGKIVYGPKRLPGGGAYTASPVAADGKIYFTSEENGVRVIQAEPPFALLAENPLGEPCLATPAIADGMIFFRTKSNVVAIGR